MKHKNSLIALAILVIIIIVGVQTNKSNQTVITTEPIKIAMSAPLSGPIAIWGEWAKRGVAIAENELKSGSGVNIETSFQDDKCQPKEASNTAQKFVNIDGVKIVLSLCAATTPTIAEIAKGKALVISAAPFTDSVLSQGYSHVISMQPPISKEAEVVAEYMLSQGIDSAGILYVSNELGVSYKDNFEREYQILGGEVTAIESFQLLDNDFRSQLLKLKESNPKGLFIVMSGAGLGNIAKQADELPFVTPRFGTNISQSKPFLDAAGESAEGFVYTYPLQFGDTQSSDTYQEAYRNQFGEEPEIYSTNSYDMVNIVSQLMEQCDYEDLKCLETKSRSLGLYEGASGKFKINDDGTADKKVILKEVKDGKFVPLLD